MFGVTVQGVISSVTHPSSNSISASPMQPGVILPWHNKGDNYQREETGRALWVVLDMVKRQSNVGLVKYLTKTGIISCPSPIWDLCSHMSAVKPKLGLGNLMLSFHPVVLDCIHCEISIHQMDVVLTSHTWEPIHSLVQASDFSPFSRRDPTATVLPGNAFLTYPYTKVMYGVLQLIFLQKVHLHAS